MNPNPSLMTQLSQTMAQGQSPMNVQTPGSPMYQPGLVSQAPPPLPDKSPMTAMPIHGAFQRRGLPLPAQLSQPTAQPQVTLPIQDTDQQTAGVQVPMSEGELIIKALSKRLDHHGKMAEKIMNATLPQPEAQPAQ